MKTLLVVASLAIAARMATFALADLSAESHPDLALLLESGHARALVSRAESSLMSDPADVDSAERDAREALRHDPLATRALQRLARAADARGDAERAASLFRAVAASTHRDLYTELRLLTDAIDDRDFASMTARLDHLLRGQNQNIWETILSPLTPVLTLPGAAQDLANLLATRPPWRTWFVHWLARGSKDIDGLQRLATAMMATAAPPRPDELGAMLGRLLEDGRGGAAHEIWSRAQPRNADDARPLLQHGRFAAASQTPPFDWLYEAAPGTNVAVRPNATAPGGTALQIDFFGGRTPFHHVTQILALPPGSYRLSGAQRAERLQAALGLIWNLSCTRNSQSIAATSPLSGDVAWRRFELDFTIPHDCPVQRLQLQLAARLPADLDVRGTAYFADLAVVRRDSGGPDLAAQVRSPADRAQPSAMTPSGRELFAAIATALRLRGRNTALEGAREAWTD